MIETESRNEIELERHTSVRGGTSRRKGGEHSSRDYLSKYSGSRKSSVDTTNTNIKTAHAVRLENTFKLGPEENKKFFAYKLQPTVLELLTEKMDNCEKANQSGYNAKACATLTCDLADSIRREAKNLSVPRYKIVVHVVTGENQEQDVRVGSRCLWNLEYDNCISVSYKTKHIWASAVIYVLYAE
jgi:hypothetical protein